MITNHVRHRIGSYSRSLGLLALYSATSIISTWGIWQFQESLDEQQRRVIAWILSIILSLPFFVYCLLYSIKIGVPLIYYPDKVWAIVKGRFLVLQKSRICILVLMIMLSLAFGFVAIVGPIFIDRHSYPLLGIFFLYPMTFYFCIMFLIVEFPE